MQGATWRTTVLFGVGVASLEVAGSLFHAYVVHDVPVSLQTMLRGDVVISALSGLALLGWQAIVPTRRLAGGNRLAWFLGFVFALFLELLNDLFPGALFSPTDIVSAVVVWTCAAVGTLGAFLVLARAGDAAA